MRAAPPASRVPPAARRFAPGTPLSGRSAALRLQPGPADSRRPRFRLRETVGLGSTLAHSVRQPFGRKPGCPALRLGRRASPPPGLFAHSLRSQKREKPGGSPTRLPPGPGLRPHPLRVLAPLLRYAQSAGGLRLSGGGSPASGSMAGRAAPRCYCCAVLRPPPSCATLCLCSYTV